MVADYSEKRFWNKVAVRGIGECWPWTGSRDLCGYGMVGFKGRLHRAHRVMWWRQGREIPAGLCVCHHCDNPSCVNPNHLWLGTKSENNKDRAKKGRSFPLRCEKNGHAKLSIGNVREIRSLYQRGGVSQRALAAKFGVVQGSIWQIINNRQWVG